MRKFIFPVHSIAGLIAGLFILVMSISGSILVFHDELTAMQYPAIDSLPGKNILPVDSCYNKLQNQFPHAEISNCDIAENNKRPFIFTIYDSSFKEGKEPLQVFLHPQTGDILKTGGSKNSLINWIATLHNSFHLNKKGEWLLGFFALIFLLNLVTGIILFRKKIWATLLFRKNVFRKQNLHQLIGVYALLFNLLLAFTGFWMQRYVFKKEFYSSENYTPVLRTSPPLFYSMDSSFTMLKEKFPDFTAYVIYFAHSKKGKTAIYGSQSTNSFIHSRKFADAIFLDSTGKVASTAFVNEIDASSRYDIINSQIHFGQYGGWTIKIIYSLFGLTGGWLSITGFLLWYKRTRSRNKTMSISEDSKSET